MEWQFAHVSNTDMKGSYVMIGPATYDPIKASRITLLNALCLWTLGRLLLMNRPHGGMAPMAADLAKLGEEIGKSKLLFRDEKWEWQLVAGMLFQPGYDWRDV